MGNNMMGVPVGGGVNNALPYNSPNRDLNYRVLWHQTLGEIIRYREIPHATMNFDTDAIEKPLTSNTRTLSSSVTSRFSSVFSDVIVDEIWRGGVSTYSGWFYELYRFFLEDLADGDELIWFPKDLNDKAYPIEALDIIVGDPMKMNINPISHKFVLSRHFLTEDVTFRFRIKKPFRKPNAVVLLQGA